MFSPKEPEFIVRHGLSNHPAVDQVKNLLDELEDVRQQRETLKNDADVRERYVRQMEEKVRAVENDWKRMKAEVERRGEILKRCVPLLQRYKFHHAWIRQILEDIDSLSPAPDQSQRGTSDGH